MWKPPYYNVCLDLLEGIAVQLKQADWVSMADLWHTTNEPVPVETPIAGFPDRGWPRFPPPGRAVEVS
jgi:hypothetical protein